MDIGGWLTVLPQGLPEIRAALRLDSAAAICDKDGASLKVQ